MKGQLSYIIKPISLVLTIVLLLLLYNSISSFGAREKTAEKDLDLVADSTNILLVLANSQLCLGYKSSVTEGLYANIVDVEKLNYFSQQYSSVEPQCARNFDFGWRVTVTEFKQSGDSIASENNWSFGAFNLSLAPPAQSVSESIPIAIRYSDKLIRPGTMTIYLVNGELERIAGSLDWICELHKEQQVQQISVQIYTSYPLSYDSNSNLLCQVSKTNSCRIMDCDLAFAGFKAPGTYMLRISFLGDKEVIR
jgi:hypothetical protein